MTRDPDAIYREFGKLVRHHREHRRPKLTQERLGELVGLSRTSITNVEKGRQHVVLHQIFALAAALNVTPDALLPKLGDDQVAARIAKKLPPGTDRKTIQWMEKVVKE